MSFIWDDSRQQEGHHFLSVTHNQPRVLISTSQRNSLKISQKLIYYQFLPFCAYVMYDIFLSLYLKLWFIQRLSTKYLLTEYIKNDPSNDL